MHNGGIAEFNKVKRAVQAVLSDEIFEVVSGNTDSEWAFALYLSKLPDAKAKTFTTDVLRKAMFDTIAHLNDLADKAGITEVSHPSSRLTVLRG
jgi:predicted glutamine amidotransferase